MPRGAIRSDWTVAFCHHKGPMARPSGNKAGTSAVRVDRRGPGPRNIQGLTARLPAGATTIPRGVPLDVESGLRGRHNSCAHAGSNPRVTSFGSPHRPTRSRSHHPPTQHPNYASRIRKCNPALKVPSQGIRQRRAEGDVRYHGATRSRDRASAMGPFSPRAGRCREPRGAARGASRSASTARRRRRTWAGGPGRCCGSSRSAGSRGA